MSNFPQGNMNETQAYPQQGPYEPGGQPQPTQVVVAKKRSTCGCFLMGCLGTVVACLIVGAIGGYFGYQYYKTQLAKYTSDTPRELPTANITQEEIASAEAKLEEFERQFEAGNDPQELVLTVDEINAILAKEPDMKGKVYISIVDGNPKAEVSVPIDFLPGGQGRYFNGSATLEIELENGVLIAHLVSAEANGNQIPDWVLQEMKRENLARDLYKDEEVAKTLRRFEELTIEPDRIILKVRPSKSGSDGSMPSDSAEGPGDGSIDASPDSESQSQPGFEGSEAEESDSEAAPVDQSADALEPVGT